MTFSHTYFWSLLWCPFSLLLDEIFLCIKGGRIYDVWNTSYNQLGGTVIFLPSVLTSLQVLQTLARSWIVLRSFWLRIRQCVVQSSGLNHFHDQCCLMMSIVRVWICILRYKHMQMLVQKEVCTEATSWLEKWRGTYTQLIYRSTIKVPSDDQSVTLDYWIYRHTFTGCSALWIKVFIHLALVTGFDCFTTANIGGSWLIVPVMCNEPILFCPEGIVQST